MYKPTKITMITTVSNIPEHMAIAHLSVRKKDGTKSNLTTSGIDSVVSGDCISAQYASFAENEPVLFSRRNLIAITDENGETELDTEHDTAHFVRYFIQDTDQIIVQLADTSGKPVTLPNRKDMSGKITIRVRGEEPQIIDFSDQRIQIVAGNSLPA